MQLSGENNNLDLYSDARYWCGIPLTDTTTLDLPTFVRSANFGLDRVISIILRADGKWQFDDSNNSGELLDITTDLVAGTQKYAILLIWLKIKKVRIKDSAGNFITLHPIDRDILTDNQLRADAGDPKRYDKLGNFLYFHPTPNHSATAGIEVQFQRGASFFLFDDTTKEPGFATDFHRLISLYGALDYCEINDLDRRAQKIRLKIGNPPMDGIPGSGMEGELAAHYARRDTDQKVGLRVRREDYGQFSDGSTNVGRRNPDGFIF